MYKSVYKCDGCEHSFEHVTAYDPRYSNKTPSCPECRKKKRKAKVNKMLTMRGDINKEKITPPEKHANGKYSCKKCFTNFLVPFEIGSEKDPFCPKCGSNETKSCGTDVPDIIPRGSKIQNKAVDETARIVMEDHKLTDLKSNIGQGETAVQKLAPHLQKQADSFFAPKNNKALPFNKGHLARQAMSGSLRDTKADPVAALSPRYKPKVNYINEPK